MDTSQAVELAGKLLDKLKPEDLPSTVLSVAIIAGLAYVLRYAVPAYFQYRQARRKDDQIFDLESRKLEDQINRARHKRAKPKNCK